MAIRVPRQAVLPFGPRERVVNRQIRQRAEGVKVRPGPGRPKGSKTGRVAHRARARIGEKTAVHVTLRLSRKAPGLRARRPYAAMKAAFAKFRAGAAFRVVHFAVLGNHVHVIVEADGRRALSAGMKSLCHSISRRINALSVRMAGGEVKRNAGGYAKAKGWIGRVFSERYHAHVLATRTEMANALQYVFTNADRHFNRKAPSTERPDPFTSFATPNLVTKPKGYL